MAWLEFDIALDWDVPIVAVDQRGQQLAVARSGRVPNDHLGLLSRRVERDLLSAGQSIVQVPPKRMAHVRAAART